MELGPYAKGPEVLKAFPTAEGFGKNATEVVEEKSL